MKTLVQRIAVVVIVIGLSSPKVGAECMLSAPTIDSPAPAANLDHDANVSCSGGASDEGISWSCKIEDSDTKSNKVTGSSTCSSGNPVWSGTVSKPAQNWTPGAATATYKENGDEMAAEDFEFVNNS